MVILLKPVDGKRDVAFIPPSVVFHTIVVKSASSLSEYFDLVRVVYASAWDDLIYTLHTPDGAAIVSSYTSLSDWNSREALASLDKGCRQ